MSLPSADAVWSVRKDPGPYVPVSLPGIGSPEDVAQFGRPSAERRSEHRDWGWYWDPFTNDIVLTNEAMETDHIYPEYLVNQLIKSVGKGRLTPRQEFEVRNYPDNFQPLPKSLNASKKHKTAAQWTKAGDRDILPAYIAEQRRLEARIIRDLTGFIERCLEENERAAKHRTRGGTR